LNAGSDIHRVAIKVTVRSDRNVTDMNADPQTMNASACYSFIRILAIQGHGGAHCQIGTWKFRQNRVAKKFDDATSIPTDSLAGECLKDFN